jgi:hypothetical protein
MASMSFMKTMESRVRAIRPSRWTKARREKAPPSRETTTISLQRDTKEFLRVLGRVGETYDDVIRRLIHYAPIKEQDRIWDHISKKGEFIPLEDV